MSYYDKKVKAFVPWIVLRESLSSLRRKLKVHLFHAEFAALPALAAPESGAPPRPRVLVAIVHVTSTQEHDDLKAAAVKIERLQVTLDGLLSSFAHCDLEVLIITMKQRHIVHFLPPRLQRAVRTVFVEGGDPMFIGYPAQDEMIARRDAHDWFIFLEDDIEIRDSSFLDKVSRFCALPGMERAVLMPNRFEYHEGVKRYIDLTHRADYVSWNKFTLMEHDGNRFGEISTPHAGVFCLSRRQLDILVESGRQWRGMDIHSGSRESAATYSLKECFKLYKPHTDNLYYLEVRHVDTRYSIMHSKVTEFTYCAVPALREASQTQDA